MKIKLFTLIFTLLIGLTSNLLGQVNEKEKKAIVDVINEAYLGGMYNNDDAKAMHKGFYDKCAFQAIEGEGIEISTLQETISKLENFKSQRKNWNNRTSVKYTILDIIGTGATVRSDVSYNKEPKFVDLLTLVKFPDGWKITFLMHDLVTEELELAREARINSDRMPPQKVFDAIGIKSGMIIGEIGAGNGRYSVQLANRVGNNGKVYANDINKSSLNFLNERCKKNGITNIETILGAEDNPNFPNVQMDIVMMVWVYHHLTKPIEILKSIIPNLKKGAKIVILDPNPEKEIDSDRPSTKERVEKEALEAGYELVEMLTFLPMDNIFILKLK